ncbi:hypothetical protein D9M68_905550 [compost metagenome]
MLQILDHHVQQVIHVAGQCVAGHHFVPAPHAVAEMLDAGRVVLLQLHTHEGLQPQPDGLGVDAGGIPGDDPRRLESLDPAQACRRRQVHLAGNVGIGGATVALQQGQQAQVGAVEGG